MPVATVSLPPDVAERLQSISKMMGLRPREAASVLLTMLLRQSESDTAHRCHCEEHHPST